jgi:hypothetical protein
MDEIIAVVVIMDDDENATTSFWVHSAGPSRDKTRDGSRWRRFSVRTLMGNGADELISFQLYDGRYRIGSYRSLEGMLDAAREYVEAQPERRAASTVQGPCDILDFRRAACAK